MLEVSLNSHATKTPTKQDQTTRWHDRNVFILNAAAVLGGVVGGILGLTFFGPLGAVAGSLAGIAIGRFCGEAINGLMLKSQNTRSFSINFRSLVETDFIEKFFTAKQGDIPGERENACLDQIVHDTGCPRTLSKQIQSLDLAILPNDDLTEPKNFEFLDLASETDSKRYITNITADKIEKIIKGTTKEIKRNILFANCQNFEISVARAINSQYDGSRYSVMQLPSNGKDSTKSTLRMNEKNRTTTLISKLRVFDTPLNKETEKFEATAVMNWDTAETSIKITPIN